MNSDEAYREYRAGRMTRAEWGAILMAEITPPPPRRRLLLPRITPVVVFILGLSAIVAGGWRGGAYGWDSAAIILDAFGVALTLLAGYLFGVFDRTVWVQDIPSTHPDALGSLDKRDRARTGAHNERHGR